MIQTNQKFRKSISSFLLVLLLFMMTFSTSSFADSKTVSAKVTEIQKYGNVVMDVKPSALYDAGMEIGDVLSVECKQKTMYIPFCTSYSDVDNGKLLVRDDKEKNLLIVAINMGNFSKINDVKVGDVLTFSLDKQRKGEYLNEYTLRQLKRTNERSDYATDSIYANFRAITTTGIKPGVLYRSASPINNEINRAKYANNLAKAVGVRTVINLADNEREIKEYVAKKDFASVYYKKLVDNGHVKLLNMSVDVASKDFGKKLADALTYMSKNDGPYLVHCTEGKDRAGFTSAVLEALMGASMDEIVADYMTTYENYYHVEKDSEQYKKIAKSNIVKSMTTTLFDMKENSDLSKVDIAKKTNEYLLKIGMKQKDIDVLKKKLSQDGIFAKTNIKGKITQFEKYGHADTDILIDDFNKKGFKIADTIVVVFDNGFVVEAPYLDNYLVKTGMPLLRAYKGHKTIAVCINYGKLNKIAKLKEGMGFTIMMNEKNAYAMEYEVRKLERTNDRKDYKSDEIYANFRSVKNGSIKENVLYRSSSPINNELNRAKYANELMEKAGIKTVINLADKDENIKKYVEAKDFESQYYKNLYDNKKVALLDLGLAYTSKEFRAGIAKSVEFMAQNDAPYLFHCTEGKDRTGFMGAFLSSLMGATKEEIIDDYMTTYFNYYNIENSGAKYEYIKQDVVDMMKSIAGTDELTKENLTKGAENLLKENKISQETIDTLRKKLAK